MPCEASRTVRRLAADPFLVAQPLLVPDRHDGDAALLPGLRTVPGAVAQRQFDGACRRRRPAARPGVRDSVELHAVDGQQHVAGLGVRARAGQRGGGQRVRGLPGQDPGDFPALAGEGEVGAEAALAVAAVLGDRLRGGRRRGRCPARRAVPRAGPRGRRASRAGPRSAGSGRAPSPSPGRPCPRSRRSRAAAARPRRRPGPRRSSGSSWTRMRFRSTLTSWPDSSSALAPAGETRICLSWTRTTFSPSPESR